jgi:hypothetical protein
MAKDCGHKVPCGCKDKGLLTPPPCGDGIDCEGTPCSETFDAQCTFYTGEPILCGEDEVVTTNMSLSEAMAAVVAYFCTTSGHELQQPLNCGETTVSPAGTDLDITLKNIVSYFCGRLSTLETQVGNNTTALLGSVTSGSATCVTVNDCTTCSITLEFRDQGNNLIDTATINLPEICGPEAICNSPVLAPGAPPAGANVVLCNNGDPVLIDVGELLAAADNIYNADGQIQGDRFITFANAGSGDAIAFFANGVIGTNSNIFGVQDGLTGQPELARVFIGESYLRNSLAFFVECKTSFLNTIAVANNDPAEPYHIILQDNQGAMAPNTYRLHLNTLPLITADRFQRFQDKDGTIALLSDIVTPSVYGLFSQTGNSISVTDTNPTGTMFGPGQGSLSVPGGFFSIGDSFKLDGSGHITANSPTASTDLEIRVLINAVQEILLVIPVDAITDLHWSLEMNFTIRTVNVGPTLGSVMTSLKFINQQDGGNDIPKAHMATNLSSLDTAAVNTLDITATWVNPSGGNDFYSEIMNLHKIY